MSGLASIGLFLLEQTVRKTIMAPLAGSRTGKCSGVLRCDRSFILSEGHALSCPRCLACPGHRVRFITSIRCVPFCFGHDEAWPSDSPQTRDVPASRLFVLMPVLGFGLMLWLMSPPLSGSPQLCYRNDSAHPTIESVRMSTNATSPPSSIRWLSFVMSRFGSDTTSEGRAPSRPHCSVVHFVSATRERGPPNAPSVSGKV